ncbi:porin, partial [Halobacteriovorax sp.]|uniref:porin n=1 Tax=Halobacteriovorax sp. TaxID=2020862 RepID=UPI00356138A1
MHVDQESKFNRKSTPGLVDTDNSESRLGAKGSYEINSSLTAKYTLELGVNSTKTDDGAGTSGRIRVRMAKIDMVSKFGTLTVGQDYTADALANLKVDTFAGTVASGVGADYAAYVENATTNMGILYRSRKDLVKYATPVFAGVQYSVSVDKADKRSNDPSSSNYGPTYTTHLVSFDKKMDAMTLRLQSSFTHWAQASTGDNSNLHVGTVLGFGNLTFKAGWSDQESKDLAGVATDTSRMTAGFTYGMGDHTAKLAYYVTEEEVGAASEEDTQISAGYEYALHKNVTMNTIVSLLEHTDSTDTTKNNEATVVSVGAVVKF